MRNRQRQKQQAAKPLQDVIAESISYYRELYELTQPALAQLMSEVLGIKWTATTVAKVEAGTRGLSAEELIALGMVLRTSITDLCWRADDAEGDVLVGTEPINNYGLNHAMNGAEWPPLPVQESLTRPGWAAVTGDTGLRELVDKEMADWEEGMRLLRKEVTEHMRRLERFRRWDELAVQYENPGLDPVGARQVVEMFGRGKVQRRWKEDS